MSEVTKPIALDESLHTTEQTPRNLADVLSDELQNLATAIGGGSDKVPKTDIATVEPTNTASRAYSVGELVYVNGNLYKVITAITNGATFTVGTNIQSTNVSEVLKDITVVYDQYFTLTGAGLIYIDIDVDYPMVGYKLFGLNIASNSVGYTVQARIRNASRITGFAQKANGGVITADETIQVGVTLSYVKI